MQIRVCDICFGNNGKITKAVGKSSNSFFRNSIRISADVCEEHKEYLKTMSGDAIDKVVDIHKKWDAKERVKKETA